MSMPSPTRRQADRCERKLVRQRVMTSPPTYSAKLALRKYNGGSALSCYIAPNF